MVKSGPFTWIGLFEHERYSAMINTLDRDAPLFIVGCSRSGTTLMRLILNTHSKICIPEETRYIPIIGANLHKYGDLSEEQFIYFDTGYK